MVHMIMMNITNTKPSPKVLFNFLTRAYGRHAAEAIFREHGLSVPKSN